MRWASVLSEAWRNLTSGTSRCPALVAVIVFAVGGLAVSDARTVVTSSREVARWRASGAAVIVLSADNAVDGAACDRLTRSSGITASGARRMPDGKLPLPQLLGSPPPLAEVTPGFARLIMTRAQGWAREGRSGTDAGILLSQDLATTLNRGASTWLDTSAGRVRVTGVFPMPDDGRNASLGYSALAPVPAAGRFDECWAEAWPPDAGVQTLMRSALAADVPGSTQVKVGQLNSSLGSDLDIAGLYAHRPTRHAPTAAFLIGLAIGWVGLRMRRLETAAALHAGVGRLALTLQLLLETVSTLVFSALLLFPALEWAARYGNPDSYGWVLGLEAITVVCGAAGVILGALIAVSTTREDQLFDLFKAR